MRRRATALLGIGVVVAIGTAGEVAWLRRSHRVVYLAEGCEMQIRHTTHEGDAAVVDARGRWERAVELTHGDVASLVVTPAPSCDEVRCAIVEDGVEVARAEGRAGAICSAWTAR